MREPMHLSISSGVELVVWRLVGRGGQGLGGTYRGAGAEMPSCKEDPWMEAIGDRARVEGDCGRAVVLRSVSNL
jgi:hypothetical protein